MEIKISFHYNGTFFSMNDKLLHRKGHIYVTELVDSDELSKFELETFLKDGAGVESVKEFWFSESRKCVSDGLQRIDADSDIISLVRSIKEDKLAHVYVMREGNVIPSNIMGGGDELTLRRSPRKRQVQFGPQSVKFAIKPNSASCPEPNSTFSSQGADKSGESSTPTFPLLCGKPVSNPISTQASTSGSRADGCSRVQPDDDEGDDAASQQSADEVSDIRFEDIADEVEDLFGGADDDARGKELAAEVTRDFHFDLGDPNITDPDSDVEDESDGLKTLEGSDDEEGKKGRYPEFNHRTDFKSPIKLVEGMLFASNEIFRKAIAQYSVERVGGFYFLHNDSKRVSVLCKMKCDCPWKHSRRACGSRSCDTLRCKFRAYASKSCDDGTFQLKSLFGEHSCGKQHHNGRATSKYLAEKYLVHYRDNPALKLPAFQNTVMRDIGVSILYAQAMRTLMRAYLMLQGNAREQYAHVCDYAETLMK